MIELYLLGQICDKSINKPFLPSLWLWTHLVTVITKTFGKRPFVHITLNKVTEVLLHKGRCAKYPFQVAALTFSILFPIPELSHVLGTPSLLFSMFGSIHTALFKASFNSLGKTFRDCISSVTNSSTRTDSFIEVQKQLFWSFPLGIHRVWTKIPPFPPSLFLFRSTEVRLPLKFYLLFLFVLVELLLPKALGES